MEPVAVPAGEGDLAVAAKFALESIDGPGAKSSAAAELDGDRSDSSSAGSSSSEDCLLYTSPSPRDVEESRMPSSA